MPAPLVSIVVPFFAATLPQVTLLAETLATVDAQTCTDYELILIDDGSPIDVTRMAETHRHVRMYRQPNAGPAVARNTGIARSRGECFVFLDADDHLLPGALETSLAALAEHPDAGFVVGPREEMTFEGQPVPWHVAPPPPQSDLYTSLLGFDWYIIPPSSVMFRRAVVEAVGEFRDPWGADDLDFYLRAARQARAFCFQHPPVTRYRRYSTSSSRDGERMLTSIRAVYARQLPLVAGDPAAAAAFARGLAQLTDIFLDCVVENIRDRLAAGDQAGTARSARVLMTESEERWRALLADAAIDSERLRAVAGVHLAD